MLTRKEVNQIMIAVFHASIPVVGINGTKFIVDLDIVKDNLLNYIENLDFTIKFDYKARTMSIESNK